MRKIGKGEVKQDIFEEAKKELLDELIDNPIPSFMRILFRHYRLHHLIKQITLHDILRHIGYSESFGSIEILTIKGQHKEAVLKLKASNLPFALIKIGDAVKWITENMNHYEINGATKTKVYFKIWIEDRK